MRLSLRALARPSLVQNTPAALLGSELVHLRMFGGVRGYDEFLEAISDPEHERHEELIEWGGRVRSRTSRSCLTRLHLRIADVVGAS